MSCEQRRKTLRSYIYLEEPRTKDAMEDLLKQMVAIEQSRVDREDKRVENEAIARKQDKAQMAEQRETDKRMMAEQRETDKRMIAEQHDRFMQLLQEVQISHERNPPPPPAPRLHIQKFCEETDDMAAYSTLKPLLWSVNGL